MRKNAIALLLTALTLTSCGGSRPGDSGEGRNPRHWLLDFIDQITAETIFRAGAAAFCLLGVLCIFAAILFGLWLQKPRTGALFGATGFALFAGGALLAWLGSNFWWIIFIVVGVACLVGFAWLRKNKTWIENKVGDIPGI